MRKNLEVRNSDLYLDGEKIQILSGAMHYFRTVPEYWEDRLKKLKNCGLNTVETYIPWNLHEPEESTFCFEGLCDIERFLKAAQALDLYVILRPSPYICAEWEFGGLPYWLLRYPDIQLRCCNSLYLDKVRAYYDVLMPILKKYLWENDSPVIAMQLENEYGSYGNDKSYIPRLKQMIESYGISTFFFTSDGTTRYMLNGGLTDGVFASANFGSDPEGNFTQLDRYRPNQPHFCMEYWCGWFQHWGDTAQKRDSQEAIAPLVRMLERGEHFNIYMFHGGTNFGFLNGANYYDRLQPTVTSYDYDALLTENGDYTEKYRLMQAALAKHHPFSALPVEPVPLRAYGKIELKRSARLFDNLDRIAEPVENVTQLGFEQLGQAYGFVLYRTTVMANTDTAQCRVKEPRDRLMFYTDGKLRGVKDRLGFRDDEIWVDCGSKDITLDVLAENLGRVNYGSYLPDKKGIDAPLTLNGQSQYGYTMYPLDFSKIDALAFQDGVVTDGTPVFLEGEFEIEECADTFLDLSGFVKGCVFVNGFHLGRYWEIGPELDLYCPAPILKKGKNKIVIFELENTAQPFLMSRDFRVKKEAE